MKPLALLTLLLLPTTLTAQRFLIGARSGIANWGDEVLSTCAERSDALATEVFVRYETRSSFAFEAGVSREQIRFKQDYYSDNGIFGVIGRGESVHTFVGLNLRGQSGTGLKRIKRLKNFVGLAVMPAVIETRQHDHFTYPPNKGTDLTSSERIFAVQLGIEDMIRYEVNRHVDVHSLIGYKFLVGGNQLQRAFTVQAGLSYVF